MSLQAKTLAAFGWSGLERLAQAVSGGVVHILLARLLAPTDFALVAMLAIFLELGRSLVDSGFTAALIQARKVSKAELTSVFLFNLLVALLLCGGLILAAPLVAGFYDQPLLTALLRVLSLRLVLDALGAIHATILSRRIDLKALASVRLPATLLGGVTGVAMALSGFGAWSLVGQVLVQALGRSGLLWLRTGWRPSGGLEIAALRRLSPFGLRVFGAALVDKFSSNLYLAVIGKLFPAASLGYYYQARRYQSASSMPLVRILNHILLPIFSSVQTEDERLRRGSAKGVRILSFAYFPCVVGLIATAPALTELLLTAKWLPAVPYFQLLGLASLTMPMFALNLNVIKAKGASRAVLRLEILRRAIELTALLVLFRWGIAWMIGGQILGAVAGLLLTSRQTRALIGFGLLPQLRLAGPYLLLAAAMGVGVHSLARLGLAPLPLVGLQVLVGAASYLGLAFALPLRAPREALDLIRRPR